MLPHMTTRLSSLLLLALCALASAAPIPDEYKTNGYAIGCQAYTFNRFSVFEAIEKTAEAGGKTIEFFPGQKLSADEPNVKWGHQAPEQAVQKVKEKLAKHHIVAVNYGVVGGRDEAEWRQIF